MNVDGAGMRKKRAADLLPDCGLFILGTVLYALIWILLERLWPHYPFFIIDGLVLYFFMFSLRIANVFFRGDRVLLALIGLAAVFLMANLMLRPHEKVYVYDVRKQKPTIEYFSAHLNYQPMTAETESNQAPLYYFLAGALHRLLGAMARAAGQTTAVDWRGVVALNYFFYMLFLIYAVRCFKYCIRSRPLVLLFTAVMLAWPSNILHAYRLGNDLLLYLAYIGSLYHFTRWYREDDVPQLHTSVLWMAVGFAAKTSMLILPGAMLLLVLRREGWRLRAWRGVLARAGGRKFLLSWSMALLIVGIGMGLGRNAYYALTVGNTTWLEGKPDSPPDYKFTPSLLGFDVWSYLSHPYSYTEGDSHYWNFFLRSLSFGEYIWQGAIQARGVNACMMLMWVYVLANIGWRMQRGYPLGWTGYWGILIASMVSAGIFIKIYFAEFIPWGDARHIFPVVVFFLLGYASLLETPATTSLRWQRWHYRIGIALLTAYLAFSLAHDALQIANPTRGPRVRW